MRQDRNNLEKTVDMMLFRKLSPPGPMGDLLQKVREHPGKRLRSKLFLAVISKEKLMDKTLHIPVAIELLHLASLIHDDLIDRSKLRRGDDSLWKSQGEPIALLCGDYLFAEAFLELNTSGIPAAVSMMRTLVQGMVCAELEQNSHAFCWQLPVAHYQRRIRLKTARFFGVAAALGGLATRQTRKAMSLFYRLGIALGMAYQLVDDLEDMMMGGDLKQGLLTLPLLELAQKDTAGLKILQHIACERKVHIDDWKCLRERLLVTNGYDSTVLRIKTYLSLAEKLIDRCPESVRVTLREYFYAFRTALISKEPLRKPQLMRKRMVDLGIII